MEYTSTLTWKKDSQPFTVKTYDRTHQIQFGGGTEISGSSAPDYLGNAKLVNPEELFVASINSCLMLTFLYLAAMKNITLQHYHAIAIGKLAKNENGKMAMSEVIITPKLEFEHDNMPDQTLLQDLFKKAHEQCIISNSVKCKVQVEI